MDKIKAFEQELNYIKDENIRKSLEIMINYIPDYFFHIAASSTGKYHPQYDPQDHLHFKVCKASGKICPRRLQRIR